MLWNLGFGWLLMAVTVVGILAFILAMALDAIMGEQGFGPTGNAVIITSGFFLAIFTANNLGMRLGDLTLAVGTGLAGAFVCLFGLTLVKAVIARE